MAHVLIRMMQSYSMIHHLTSCLLVCSVMGTAWKDLAAQASSALTHLATSHLPVGSCLRNALQKCRQKTPLVAVGFLVYRKRPGEIPSSMLGLAPKMPMFAGISKEGTFDDRSMTSMWTNCLHDASVDSRWKYPLPRPPRNFAPIE